MRRRNLIAALSAVFLALAGVLALLIDSRTMASFRPESLVVPVLVGEEQFVELSVHNRHPWRALELKDINTNCGCLQIVGMPGRVDPRSSEPIRVRVFVEVLGTRTLNRVFTTVGDRIVLQTDIRADPVLPFAGWPAHAEGEFDAQSQTTIVQFDPRYRERIVEVQVASAAGTPVETMFDPDQCVVVFVDPGEEGVLSVTFLSGDGQATWTGGIFRSSDRASMPSP